MSGRELLDELEAQETRLVFDSFDEQTAWDLGVALRDAGLAAGLPIAISIRRNGQDSSTPRCPAPPPTTTAGWHARVPSSTAMAARRYGSARSSGFAVSRSTRTPGSTWRPSPRTVARSRSSYAGPAASARSRSPGCPSWRTTASSSRRSKPCWPDSGRLESRADAVDVAAEHDLRLRHQRFIA